MALTNFTGTESGTDTVIKLNNIIREKANISLNNLDSSGEAKFNAKISKNDLLEDGIVKSEKLPIASETDLGAVKIGAGIKIDEAGVISSPQSRYIGEILSSMLPLTDSGLHLLDGSLIDGEGMYSDFVRHMADLYAENPSAPFFAQRNSVTEYNYGQVGLIDIQNGIISGFHFVSADYNYATIPVKNPESSMDLVLKVKQSALVANSDIIRGCLSNCGILLRNVNATTGQLNIYLSGNGTSFNIASNFKTNLYLTADEWIYIRISWDGTKYSFYQSSDGETWTAGATKESSVALNFNENYMCLGGSNWYAAYYFTNGYIDLNESYLSIDDELYWTGRTDTKYTPEEYWQYMVSKYGAYGKFVYNSANNTIRLPKLTGFIEGTTDLNALCDFVEAYAAVSVPCRGWEKTNITPGRITEGRLIVGSGRAENSEALESLSSAGIDRIATGRVVQPQAVKVLYYIVLATAAKMDLEVDINNIAADVNSKADVDLTNVTPSSSFASTLNSAGIRTVIYTYNYGKSWERIYSDGWCEQGGFINTQANIETVPLFDSYREEYQITLTIVNNANSYAASVYSQTQNSFQIYVANTAYDVYWKTEGYIS